MTDLCSLLEPLISESFADSSGTNLGRRPAEKVYVLKMFVPSSLALTKTRAANGPQRRRKPRKALADRKKGQQKGAASKNVKNRQKVSKIFSTLFDIFRAGQKTSKIVKKCQQ